MKSINEELILKTISEEAYPDMAKRTMRNWKGDCKEEYKTARKFYVIDTVVKPNIIQIIRKDEHEFCIINGQNIIKANSFDDWHCRLCCLIKKKMYEKKEGLYAQIEISHGQAQKLLNMTLKNLYHNDEFKNDLLYLRDYLHAPVDKYTIMAARDLAKQKNKKIHLPRKDGEIVAWSKWDKTDYNDFQDDLLNVLKTVYGITRIDWEKIVWNIYRGSDNWERSNAEINKRIDCKKCLRECMSK